MSIKQYLLCKLNSPGFPGCLKSADSDKQQTIGSWPSKPHNCGTSPRFKRFIAYGHFRTLMHCPVCSFVSQSATLDLQSKIKYYFHLTVFLL